VEEGGEGRTEKETVCGLHSKKNAWSCSMVTAESRAVPGGRGVRWRRCWVVVRTGRGVSEVGEVRSGKERGRGAYMTFSKLEIALQVGSSTDLELPTQTEAMRRCKCVDMGI
jgi:hypothetical protein